jgi:hypothetical protein
MRLVVVPTLARQLPRDLDSAVRLNGLKIQKNALRESFGPSGKAKSKKNSAASSPRQESRQISLYQRFRIF